MIIRSQIVKALRNTKGVVSAKVGEKRGEIHVCPKSHSSIGYPILIYKKDRWYILQSYIDYISEGGTKSFVEYLYPEIWKERGGNISDD